MPRIESGNGQEAFDYRIPLALFALVLAVFVITLPGSFFPDDLLIVAQNPLIEKINLYEIFTTDYWGRGENSGLFRPLTVLSFAINRTLLGEEPLGFLLVNLLLHALVSWLLYVYLRKCNLSVLTAWVAAGIFAVHPIHSEAVVPVVGRSELLVGFFGLATLILARSVRQGSWPLAVLSFSLALLSKENAIVLLALVPLADLFFYKPGCLPIRSRGKLWASLLVTATGWFLYRKYVNQAIPHVLVYDPYAIPLGMVDDATRVLSALQLQARYLLNLVFPVRLLGMYPVSIVKPLPQWFSLTGLCAIVSIVAVTALLFVGWRRRMLLALFGCFYLISFLPASQLFFPTEFSMADRVAYFPSLWFCPVLAGLVLQLCKRKVARVVVLLVVCGFYLTTGVVRAAEFRTPEHLWQSDLRKTPENEISMLMLGDYYRAQGRKFEAEEVLRRLSETAPGFEQGLAVYAGVLVEQGKPQEAIVVAKKAVGLMQGGNTRAKIPMAAAYNQLGRADEALATLATITEEDQRRAVYWSVRGRALEIKGDFVGALFAYRREMAIGTGVLPEIYYRLGRVLLQLGDVASAQKAITQELAGNPGHAAAWNALGIAYAQQGKLHEAKDAFKKAAELQPASREYRANLERVAKNL